MARFLYVLLKHGELGVSEVLGAYCINRNSPKEPR